MLGRLNSVGCFSAVHALEDQPRVDATQRRADMADNKGQQGTGHHPHKSTEEPWPHTKEEGATHGKSHSGDRDDNRSHSQEHAHASGDNRSHGGGDHRSHGGDNNSDRRR
jgi:hypothetical protein